MRRIERTNAFRRDFKREQRGQHRRDVEALIPLIVALLAEDKALAAEFEAAEKDAITWAKRLAVERRRVAHSLERQVASELHTLALDGVANGS